MTGKTHFKIGVLTYAIATTVPAVNSSFIFNNDVINLPKGLNVAGLLMAGFAALVVDADSQHSMINKMNPFTGAIGQGIEMAEGILKTIVRLVITFGLAFIMFNNSDYITQNLTVFLGEKPCVKWITYGIGALVIVIGISDKRFLVRLPVIGDVYLVLVRTINKGISFLKRITMTLVYAGAGIGILIFNLRHNGETGLYLVGLMLIAVAVFPHRSFMHSVMEGLPLMTLTAGYVFTKVGLGYLTGAFFIGYASHILLADMLTKEGVPLSVVPMVLERIGVHHKLHKYALYKVIHGVLNLRLKIPLMSTGTSTGNLFEIGYTFILLAFAVVYYIYFGK